MKFEILLSTMFKTNLDFLDSIFFNNQMQNYNILIVNQTTKEKLLFSNKSNIRVFNSYEKGTSASRNLAIKNAKGNICLFADDDITYKPKFHKIILDSFDKYKDAYLLSFETTDENNIAHIKYPKEGIHNKKTLKTTHMTGMAIRRELLLKSNTFFNPYFSLGGMFSGGTEYIFLREAYSKKLKAYHVSKSIVEHPEHSSGKELNSDRVIHTTAARYNHFFGNIIAIIALIKYILFLVKKRLINFNQIIPKITIGLKGIKEYNKLIDKGLIKRQK